MTEPKDSGATPPGADPGAPKPADPGRKGRGRGKRKAKAAEAEQVDASRAGPERESQPTSATAPASATTTDAPGAGQDTPPAADATEASKARAPRRRSAKRSASEGTPAEAAPAKAPRRGASVPADQATVVRARARYVRSSARKARMVCPHIRGKSVPEARAILAFAPRAVARDWAKLLDSAVANAENNHELVAEDLRVRDVFADEGPTLKRYRPRAMGRATPIRKRTSHLTITLVAQVAPARPKSTPRSR